MTFTGFTPDQIEKLTDLGELVSKAIEDKRLRDHQDTTGFVPMHFKDLLGYMETILLFGPKEGTVSLELGCGAGAWTMLAASLGFPSYGIDINPELVDASKHIRDKARKKGLLDPSVPCEFAVGNFFTPNYLFEKREFLINTCYFKDAWKKQGDPYKELGIDIKDAGIIYSWPWPQEIKVAGDFLSQEVADSAIVVLPYYDRQNSLTLSPFKTAPGANHCNAIVGTKKESKTAQPIEADPSSPGGESPYHVGDIISLDRRVGAWEYSIPAGSEAMIRSVFPYKSIDSTYCEVELTKWGGEKLARNKPLNIFQRGIVKIVEMLGDEEPIRSPLATICLRDIGGIVKKFDNAEYARELGIVPQEAEASYESSSAGGK
jgi:hypothetical protein